MTELLTFIINIYFIIGFYFEKYKINHCPIILFFLKCKSGLLIVVYKDKKSSSPVFHFSNSSFPAWDPRRGSRASRCLCGLLWAIGYLSSLRLDSGKPMAHRRPQAVHYVDPRGFGTPVGGQSLIGAFSAIFCTIEKIYYINCLK